MSKIGKIRSLTSDTFVYGMSTILSRFISVFLVPVYTRIFDPADFGVVNLVNTSLLLIGIFVIAGLDNAAARFYWDNEDDHDRNITFSSWFWSQLAMSALVVLLMSLFSIQISRLVTGNSSASLLFILAAANLPFTTLNLVYTSWLRIKRKAVVSVTCSLANSLLTIVLSIILVVILDRGLPGVFMAQLISNALCAIPAAVAMRKHVRLRLFRSSRLRDMLRYSFPLVPAVLAFWVLNSAGTFIINHFGDKADVGLFQVGSSIAAVCGMVFWAFLQAWSPFAISIHKQRDAKQTYATVLNIYASAGSLLVLFVFLFAPEILSIIATEEYVPASLVGGILCINIFISNIAQITSIGSAIEKTNKPYLHGVLLGSALSVLLYAVLIPVFNKEGAALSTLGGSILISVYVSVRSQALYRIPFNFMKVITVIVVLLAACGASLFVDAGNYGNSFVLKALLLIVFALFLLIVNRALLARVFTRLSILPVTTLLKK